MAENGFECVREEGVDNKLWVRTPFPVTHNVWGFFVKDIFPRFSIDKAKFSYYDSNLLNAMERWKDPRHRYLVREINSDETLKSCIADGEGFRWTHADLPDDKDKRAGLRVHDWGLIYIPHPAQVGYLDEIAGDLNGEFSGRTELLSQINQQERDTMEGLLLKLKGALEEHPQTIDELRRRVIGVYGSFPWMNSDYANTKLFEIGKLPLTSKNPMNTVEGQTKLDFYRNLDYVLNPATGPVPENGGIKYCMDSRYRHLTGEWIVCPELNELERKDPVARMLSNHGPL